MTLDMFPEMPTKKPAKSVLTYCPVCGQEERKNGHNCPGVPVIHWDDWNKHSDWVTLKQLIKARMITSESSVAAVWYTNKKLYRSGGGHWLMLYDRTKAVLKPLTEKQQRAKEKAQETARRNRTCYHCQKDAAYKIKRPDGLCNRCVDLAYEIKQAREWLASDAVILDTETTGLSDADEIIQIAIVDIAGNILLDTYIKPQSTIHEETGNSDIDENGYAHYEPTAFEVNGITNAMVADAPTFDQIQPMLIKLLTQKVVLAYNAEFDSMMVFNACCRYQLPFPSTILWDCVMEWYSDNHGEYSRKYGRNKFISLSNACAEQDVDVDLPTHSGAGDAMRTLELIKMIAAKEMPKGRE